MEAGRRSARQEPNRRAAGFSRDRRAMDMTTSQIPPEKEKAHEIAQKIANQRPLKRDKDAPEDNATGGFNQKSRLAEDEAMHQQVRREKGEK
jgi:hypothetical protein